MTDSSFPDIAKFKQIAKEVIRNKLILMDFHSEELFTMSLALSAAVKKIFYEKSETKFSSEPLIEKKLITQFVGRMRVDAMEKFNMTTFLSTIHYYKDAASVGKGEPSGLIIIYIERTYVPEMLRLFKYPYIDYDNDEEVLDGIGAIANLISGQFKKELVRLGYIDLEMSPFQCSINHVINGIEYCRDQTHKYEILFEIDNKPRMVVELVMSPIPKSLGDS